MFKIGRHNLVSHSVNVDLVLDDRRLEFDLNITAVYFVLSVLVYVKYVV